ARKGITTSNAVEHPDVLEFSADVRGPINVNRPTNTVFRGGNNIPKRSSGGLQIRVSFEHSFGRFVELLYRRSVQRRIKSFDTENNISLGKQVAVDLIRGCTAAAAAPKRFPKIEIIRDDSSARSRRTHCRESHRLAILRQRREDATRVKPSRSLPFKERSEIEVIGHELGYGGVRSIRATRRRPRPETAFDKVQPIPHISGNAVNLAPNNIRRINAALTDKVFNKAADAIVSKCRNDGRSGSETMCKSSGNIILAAAFPNSKTSRSLDTFIARVESEHDLAEGDQVPRRFPFLFDLEHLSTDDTIAEIKLNQRNSQRSPFVRCAISCVSTHCI